MKRFTSGLVCALLTLTSAFAQPGTLDKKFGTHGKVITPIDTDARSASVVIQGDGKILAAGYSTMGTDANFALVRYNQKGDIDSAFGNNGIVLTDFGKYEKASSIAISPHGKILVAGISYPNDLVLAQYKNNGQLDGSFGTNGKIIKSSFLLNSNGKETVVFQANGRIVVACTTASQNFGLLRYTIAVLV